MSETSPSEYPWWDIEPPIEVGLEEPEEDLNVYLDGTQSHNLFENVSIADQGANVAFNVPNRFIDTPNNGKWMFNIYGRSKWFKERDDYGEIRFTSEGSCLWIPHLFPFEETDARGLPLILDRERCELTVLLQPLNDNESSHTNTAITTNSGNLFARESFESFNPDNTRYFTEFTFSGRPLLADNVSIPVKKWTTLVDYYSDNGLTVDYLQWRIDMLEGKVLFPQEYEDQDKPNPWQERKPSEHMDEAFGAIWVPVDDLRRGIPAEISFPCFSNENLS